jgi:hypothetical protein
MMGLPALGGAKGSSRRARKDAGCEPASRGVLELSVALRVSERS